MKIDNDIKVIIGDIFKSGGKDTDAIDMFFLQTKDLIPKNVKDNIETFFKQCFRGNRVQQMLRGRKFELLLNQVMSNNLNHSQFIVVLKNWKNW